jgi:hypothetical protein
MSAWSVLLVVFGAGVVGGTINALISDNGFVLPRRMSGILRPGWLGNAMIGGVAAVVSWSLYGPQSARSILSWSSDSLPLSAFGGAILVGVAGSRWLSNEVDKTLLRAAGVEAARHPNAGGMVEAMSTLSPAAALQAAQSSVVEPGPPLVRQ